MEEFKGTKGTFADGTKSWKVSERKTNGVSGYEIHWSDDGECVTDHVYTLEDANIIAAAPLMLNDLNDLIWLVEHHATIEEIHERIEQTKNNLNKALGL